jgi:hypothetical protein
MWFLPDMKIDHSVKEFPFLCSALSRMPGSVYTKIFPITRLDTMRTGLYQEGWPDEDKNKMGKGIEKKD